MYESLSSVDCNVTSADANVHYTTSSTLCDLGIGGLPFYLSSAWPCAIGHWNLLDIYHCTADMINCSVSLKSTMTTKSIDTCSRFLIKLVWNFLLFWCQHALWPLLRRSTFVNEIFFVSLELTKIIELLFMRAYKCKYLCVILLYRSVKDECKYLEKSRQTRSVLIYVLWNIPLLIKALYNFLIKRQWTIK